MFPLSIPNLEQHNDTNFSGVTIVDSYVQAPPNSARDTLSVFQTASEIRRKIGKMFASSDQLTALRNHGQALSEKESKYPKRTFEEDEAELIYLKSGSGWTMETLVVACIYLEPVSYIRSFLPPDSVLSTEGVFVRFPLLREILLDEQDEDYVATQKFKGDARITSDSCIHFLTRLKLLLGKVMQNEASDSLMKALLRLVGVDNCRVTKLEMRPQDPHDFKTANFSFSATPELLIVRNDEAEGQEAVVAFSEDKKLDVHVKFSSMVAQRAAEALCIITDHEGPVCHFVDQGNALLYGLAMRGCFLSFYVAMLPAEYLSKFGVESLNAAEFGILKVYPASLYGFDLRIVPQRRQAVLCLASLIQLCDD